MTIIKSTTHASPPPLISSQVQNILNPYQNFTKFLPLPILLSLSLMLALPVSQMTCHVLIMWLSCGTWTKPWRKVCNHHYSHHCYYQKPSNPLNWKNAFKDGSIRYRIVETLPQIPHTPTTSNFTSYIFKITLKAPTSICFNEIY